MITSWWKSLETITISSRVRIDARVSAAARVVHKHAVLVAFIRNTQNLGIYSPVVSQEILGLQRIRDIDHRVDDSENGLAFIPVHPYPPCRTVLPLNVFFGSFGQYLYGKFRGGLTVCKIFYGL